MGETDDNTPLCRHIFAAKTRDMEKQDNVNWPDTDTKSRQHSGLERRKAQIQLISAVALTAVGAALLIAGFIVAPLGEIHSSVLVSFGEILTFAGAIFGIDYRYK